MAKDCAGYVAKKSDTGKELSAQMNAQKYYLKQLLGGTFAIGSLREITAFVPYVSVIR